MVSQSPADRVPGAGRARLASLRRIGLNFGVLHALHTGLNLVYGLAQLLVFARVLAPASYAQVVFLTAIGFYFQPFDQAIGRANYVSLRSPAGEAGLADRPEIAWLIGLYALVVIAASALIPFGMATAGPAETAALALYLFNCLFMNYWSFIAQSTAWAAGFQVLFALVSIVRRLLLFTVLAVLWWSRDFLVFGIVSTLLVAVAAAVFLILARDRSRPSVRSVPSPSRQGAAAYARQLWSSWLATLSEFVTLNSPYALIPIIFGIGPILVIFDSVMRLTRLVMAGTRTFAEIALPRLSRLELERNGRAGRRALSLVCAVCLLAALAPAAAAFWDAGTVFTLLLGPNNIVPVSTGSVIALIVLASGLYQPAMIFLSYLDAKRAIAHVTLAALTGAGLFALCLLGPARDPVTVLACYGAYFAALTVLVVFHLSRIFRHVDQNTL